MLFGDLPCELETEILARVPANSLAKLKTTCTRWYSLFKDPKFVEKNLAKGAAAKQDVIIMTRSGVYSIRAVDPTMDISGKLKCDDWKISQIVECNGLVLCSTEDDNPRLVVWNPCTGETMRIKPRICFTDCDFYDFGCGNGYKILRFASYQNEEGIRVRELEIYDLSSGSWRVRDDDYTERWVMLSPGVWLRGSTYWIALDKKTAGDFCTVLSFDYTRERFVSFPLPYQSVDNDEVSLSVAGEDRIAVLYQMANPFQSGMSIWLSNKMGDDDKDVVVSWSVFFVVDFEKFGLHCDVSVLSFLVDMENKVAVCGGYDEEGRCYVYIVGEDDSPKQVYKDTATEGFRYAYPILLSYSPSLIRIPGCKEKARGD